MIIRHIVNMVVKVHSADAVARKDGLFSGWLLSALALHIMDRKQVYFN